MTPIDTVIVAYRSDDVIGHAVATALELHGRVVVVDHGDGESARLAGETGAVAIHDPSNPGFGTGQNHGLAFTDAEYVLLCNPDAEIVPEAIMAGVRLLVDRPDVAAVQGVILNRATGLPERSAGVELGPVHLVGRALGAKALFGLPGVALLARRSSALADYAVRVPPEPVEVASLAATATLVRRAAIEAAGGFDESYFLYGEDLDLCRRLRGAGWKLLAVPEVWATHTSGGSAESDWDRETNWWRGTMQFAALWWSSPAWCVAVGSAAVRWARLGARHPGNARAALRALLADPVHNRRKIGSTDPFSVSI